MELKAGPAVIDNFARAQALLRQCAAWGVEEFCLGAGSRHGALVAALAAADPPAKVFTFFDERSAAFFALGRSRARGRPVVVMTTSGTAAAELLPATIEAHYAGVPLILVTADRPLSYRGTGAPQAIEQAKLYGPYVSAEWEIDEKAWPGPDRPDWDQRSPLHINMAFADPILDRAPARWSHDSAGVPSKAEKALSLAQLAHLKERLGAWRRPLVILSTLPSGADREALEKFLLHWRPLVYAEATSGLRESATLDPLLIKSGERLLFGENFDGILRIGAVPTLDYWRSLETGRPVEQSQVVAVDSKPFTGLSGAPAVFLSDRLREWPELPPLEPTPYAQLRARDAQVAAQVRELLAKEPQSEAALLHALSRRIPAESQVFLGNSLPVREWNQVAHRRARGLRVLASRGANGIDGQVSAFLGLAATDLEKSHWGIFGDITALYDLQAPWILPQLGPQLRAQIVVIANGGGQIFPQLPVFGKNLSREILDRYFVLAHNTSLQAWAALWGMGYERWQGEIPPHDPGAQVGVIEVLPDEESSRRFRGAYEKLFLSARKSSL